LILYVHFYTPLCKPILGQDNQRSVPSYTQANAMETLREPKEYEKIKKMRTQLQSVFIGNEVFHC